MQTSKTAINNLLDTPRILRFIFSPILSIQHSPKHCLHSVQAVSVPLRSVARNDPLDRCVSVPLRSVARNDPLDRCDRPPDDLHLVRRTCKASGAVRGALQCKGLAPVRNCFGQGSEQLHLHYYSSSMAGSSPVK